MIAALAVGAGAAVFAAEPALMFNVWPGTPPGDKPGLPPEEWAGMTLKGTVSTPALAVYRPAKEKDTGAAVLIYPGGIIQRDSEVPAVTPDVRVAKDTPPTFLSISHDDRGGSVNAVYLYLALKRAGVPAELHVWGEGGHGYGIRPGTAPHTTWPARAADWMTVRGLLQPAK